MSEPRPPDARGSRRHAVPVALLLSVMAAIALVAWSADGLEPSRLSYAEGDGLFLTPSPVVVMADRAVCSVLGDSKAAAGIQGQDSGATVEVDGVVYWTFGDTGLTDGGFLPNVIGSSPDKDASDCVDLVPKEEDGRAMPLLVREPGELTVWPLGMESTAPGKVHTFYMSVEADPEAGWKPTGVGLASFNTETLTAERAWGGALIWPEGLPLPVRTYSDETHVYVFLIDSDLQARTTETILARVTKGSIESPSEYQFWETGPASEEGHWVGGLWDEKSGAWNSTISDISPLWTQEGFHNGVEVAYNGFLGRYLAVYSADSLTSVRVRTAGKLTGPWDTVETELVHCPDFIEPSENAFMCYSGSQHEYYAADGDRTIYVSFSEGRSYQTYLHEIRLAAPVLEWNEGPATLYVAGDAKGPEGYTPGGLAFYASDIPVPGTTAIHRWQQVQSGEVYYGAAPPEPPDEYEDQGVDFYAPLTAQDAAALHAPYAAVYRWADGTQHRYSPLNLRPFGYDQQELAFYGPCPDADHDTLTDCEESFLGSDPTAADSDGDGCTDLQESQTAVGSEIGGGRRDPTSYWDFFDVYPFDPAARDGSVTIGDLGAVVLRFGSARAEQFAGEEEALAEANTMPPLPPAYHAAFDRSPAGAGEESWNAGPPDGSIVVGDIGAIAAQFGHSCA